MNLPGTSTAPARPSRPVTMSTMKKVTPVARRTPAPIPQASELETLVETLRQRVNDLEARIAELESVICVQNQDVVISAPKSVLIQGSLSVEISAAGSLKMSAGISEFNSALSRFSGLVECETIKANMVMGSSYTPGAGNIW